MSTASTASANTASTSSLAAEVQSALEKHCRIPVESAAGREIGSTLSSDQVLEREFLEMRALVLQLAASLDRVGRSKSPAADEKKRELLNLGIQILLGKQDNRAALVQMLFSNPYDPQWTEQYGLELDPQKRG